MREDFVMLIVQLSDLHFVAPGKRLYRQIDTAGALARAVERVNGLLPGPDLVVISGDLVERGSIEEYEALRQQLARLAVPFRLLPGNHDDRANLRQVFVDQDFSGEPLLCQGLEVGDLGLLLLDTVIPGEEGGEIGAAQLAWLDAACPAERPVLLFLHHPPFATGIAGMDVIGLSGADRLAAWLAAHRNVRGIACGHVHRAVFTSFAGVAAVIAPSPAHQIALDLDGDPAALAWTLEPGGMLLHRYANDSLVTHVLPVDPAPVQRYD